MEESFQKTLLELKRLYQRKRPLVAKIVNEVVSRPQATKATDLRSLLDFTSHKRRLLQSISKDFATLGATLFLLTIFKTKLLNETRRDWEIKVAEAEIEEDSVHFVVKKSIEDSFVYLGNHVHAETLYKKENPQKETSSNNAGSNGGGKGAKPPGVLENKNKTC